MKSEGSRMNKEEVGKILSYFDIDTEKLNEAMDYFLKEAETCDYDFVQRWHVSSDNFCEVAHICYCLVELEKKCIKKSQLRKYKLFAHILWRKYNETRPILYQYNEMGEKVYYDRNGLLIDLEKEKPLFEFDYGAYLKRDYGILSRIFRHFFPFKIK